MSNGYVSGCSWLSWLLCRSLPFTLEIQGGLSRSERHLLVFEGTDYQVGKGLGQAAEGEKGPVPVFPGKNRVMTLGMKLELGRKRYRGDFPYSQEQKKNGAIIGRGRHFSRGHASGSFSFSNTKILNFSDPGIQLFRSSLKCYSQHLSNTRPRVKFFSRDLMLKFLHLF